MFEDLQLNLKYTVEEMVSKPIRFKKIAKNILNDPSKKLIDIKVKVLGGYTNETFINWLEVFLVGFKVKTTFSPRIWGAAYTLLPSFNFNDEDSSAIVCLNCSVDFNFNHCENENNRIAKDIIEVWSSFIEDAQLANKKIIATYYEDDLITIPIKDRDTSSNYLIYIINNHLAQLAKKYPCLHLVSTHSLTALENFKVSSGWRDWFAYGQYFSPELSLVLAHYCANLINAFLGGAKKVLVVDFDNTLWGGVIGDDGVDGIKLGDESYEGRIHHKLQSYIKGLQARGIMIAAASKNEQNIARQAFKNPNMILKWDDFTCREIHWGAKSQSIKNIAKKLNIGLDSIVFLDDNPVERAEVKKALPMVLVPDIDDAPLDFIKFLHLRDPFVITTSLTIEDKQRNREFSAEEDRRDAKSRSSSYQDFLISLNTCVTVFSPNKSHLERIVQLTNKTNQFNLTTTRITTEEAERKMSDVNNIVIAASIQDKFGNYGLTSLMYISILGKEALIDNWVMSCRVFSKMAEHAIINEVIKILQDKKISVLKSSYKATEKNAVVADLFPSLGFKNINSESKDSNTNYELNIENEIVIEHYCEVKNEL